MEEIVSLSKCVKQFSLGYGGLHVVFHTKRGRRGASLIVAREHVYSVKYVYIECLYFPWCFRSGFLHKLKINGHQHGFSAVAWVHSAFFRMVFSFGTVSWSSRSGRVCHLNLFHLWMNPAFLTCATMSLFITFCRVESEKQAANPQSVVKGATDPSFH